MRGYDYPPAAQETGDTPVTPTESTVPGYQEGKLYIIAIALRIPALVVGLILATASMVLLIWTAASGRLSKRDK